MSLRARISALLFDAPHLARDWKHVRNRQERLSTDGRGVRCEWLYTSELNVAKVYPRTGAWLLRRALREWPIELAESPASIPESPEVSFIVGHRGLDRLPLLRQTLRSIAAQRGVAFECIVVEQSARPEIAEYVPSWARHVHTSASFDYSRAWAFNVGARLARGRVLVLHDNDLLAPVAYASEAVARVGDGASFADLKRFLFYLGENAALRDVPISVVQNAHGGSIVATRDAYFAIGGFDESFIGWGGEDNDFFERAEVYGNVYGFGYLPMIHLFHPPQKGKIEGRDAPAVRRYWELAEVPPRERIERLREREIGRIDAPSVVPRPPGSSPTR